MTSAQLFRRGTAITLLAKGWAVLAGIIQLGLITTLLTEMEQGYFYTFSGMILMQVLLELGFGLVIMQFVAHDWAHLRLSPAGEVEGDDQHRQRLGALLRLGIKWYAALSIIFLLLVGPIGQTLLSMHSTAGVSWRWPWWLLCLGVSLSILTVPLRSLLEGVGEVADSYRIALFAGVASSLCGWAALAAGWALYAAPLIIGVSAAISLLLLLQSTRPYLRLMRGTTHHFDWKSEFLPQQIRIGISWFSGFFIFQSFVPITFALRGPSEAGQIGVALQIYNAINSLAASYLANVQPRFGALGAHGEYREMRSLVRRTVALSMVLAFAFGGAALLAIQAILHFLPGLAHRFPSLMVITPFVITAVLMQISNVETAAIRYQRVDPFWMLALIIAALTTLSNFGMCWFWGISGTAIGFMVLSIGVLLPFVHRIYRKKIEQFEVKA